MPSKPDPPQRPTISLTYTRSRVVREFLKRPDEEHHGLDLSQAIGTSRGAIYPMLELLKHRGWLTDRWETEKEAEDRKAKGNRRRYWKVKPDKLPELMDYVKRWDDKARGR